LGTTNRWILPLNHQRFYEEQVAWKNIYYAIK